MTNQKHSDSGSLRDEVTLFEDDLLRNASDGDKHSFPTSNHEKAVLSKRTETEVCF